MCHPLRPFSTELQPIGYRGDAKLGDPETTSNNSSILKLANFPCLKVYMKYGSIGILLDTSSFRQIAVTSAPSSSDRNPATQCPQSHVDVAFFTQRLSYTSLSSCTVLAALPHRGYCRTTPPHDPTSACLTLIPQHSPSPCPRDSPILFQTPPLTTAPPSHSARSFCSLSRLEDPLGTSCPGTSPSVSQGSRSTCMAPRSRRYAHSSPWCPAAPRYASAPYRRR